MKQYSKKTISFYINCLKPLLEAEDRGYLTDSAAGALLYHIEEGTTLPLHPGKIARDLYNKSKTAFYKDENGNYQTL